MLAPTEDKCDDTKDSFYEELERVFDKFLSSTRKCCKEISMQRWGGKIFLNPQLGMRVYTKLVDNCGRAVNFATPKNLDVRSTKFSHRKTHKYAWTSLDGNTHNQIDPVLTDKRRQSSKRCPITDHNLLVEKHRERLSESK
jgi:hypothetical protein